MLSSRSALVFLKLVSVLRNVLNVYLGWLGIGGVEGGGEGGGGSPPKEISFLSMGPWEVHVCFQNCDCFEK